MLASIRQRPILIIILGLIAGLCLCCVIIFIIFPVDFFDRLTESLELETPVPTIAPERTLEAMFFAGTGNEDVDVDKGSEPALAHFTYSGQDNFIVWGYDPGGQQNSLLVNTIGAYDGLVPLDFLVGEHTTRFDIESSGSWTVEILPLIEANSVAAPGSYQGTGDDIVSISGCEPAGATFNKDSVGEIVVISYGESIELLVEQLMPFEGIDVALPPEIVFLEVKSEEPWTVSLSC